MVKQDSKEAEVGRRDLPQFLLLLSHSHTSPSSFPCAGPAVLALSHPSLPPTASLLPPRARRPPWKIQSDLADARQDRSTRNLLAFLHFEKYQLHRTVWLCLTFRYHVTLMDYAAWRCLASASFMVVMVRDYILDECFHLDKNP